MKKNKIKIISLVLTLGVVSACTPLKPWERGNLALSQMALDPDGQEAAFRQHTFYSKESASGGYGGHGGGCGCN